MKWETLSQLKLLLLSFVAGLLLFLTFLFMLLDSTVFSGSFQQAAFDRLGIYESIADMTIPPVLDFTAKLPQPTEEGGTASNDSSLEPSEATAGLGLQTGNSEVRLQSFMRENLNRRMIRQNIQSMISGLTAYLRGETRKLPDLQLAGSSAFQRINLSVLILYFGEKQITDVLVVTSFVQFMLSHLPAFSILLFFSILAIMLKEPPDQLYHWLRESISTYCILSLAAGFLIQHQAELFMPTIVDKLTIPFPALKSILPGYIRLFANTLTLWFLFSAALLFLLFLFTDLFLKKGLKCHLCSGILQARIDTSLPADHVSCMPTDHVSRMPTGHVSRMSTVHVRRPANRTLSVSDNCASTSANHGLHANRYTAMLLFIALALLGFLFFSEIKSASADFENRNLRQAFSILSGKNLSSGVTSARNDLVYLLEVRIMDSAGKEPLSGLRVSIIKNDQSSDLPDEGTKLRRVRLGKIAEVVSRSPFENRTSRYTSSKKAGIVSQYRLSTDVNGSADFLLRKGAYSLVLESTGTPASSAAISHTDTAALASSSAAALAGTGEASALSTDSSVSPDVIAHSDTSRVFPGASAKLDASDFNACDFEMTLAGRSVLTIESGKLPDGTVVIQNAAFQFIP